jgi:murein DD-endopeptidase MepM/ murein hydrolase activator NlpD
MIHHIKQEPSRSRGINPGINRRGIKVNSGKPLEKKDPASGEPRPAASPLSLPILPAACLCLLVLGAVFALNWQENSFSWMRREAVSVNPGADEGGRFNLALYAGLAQAAPGSSPSAARTEPGEAIPLDLTETFAWRSYTVKRGDSVSAIAAAFSISMDAIIASNNISNARLLREGEPLKIPNMDGIPYTAKNGDSLSRISQSMGVPLEAILDANDIQRDAISAGQLIFIPGARMRTEDLKLALGELFIYPLKGARLSSQFGWRNDPISGVRRHHAAIDLAAPTGTTVKAAMDGKVSTVGFNSTYGKYIILSHGGDYQTMYAHLSRILVQNGVYVNQGTVIGRVGSTGRSTGPHLHFAVYKNKRAINPLEVLNK